MTKPARFQVDPRLAHLLGEGYRSSEQALKELVDNAWDADARNVHITLPAPMTSAPIIIEDDGTGMTEDEVRSEYLKVASDRRSRKGDLTERYGRQVKGRKGIGKFAGLMAASTMAVDSRARGGRTRLRIRKEDLLQSQKDLEKIDLLVNVEPCEEKEHGTTITLNDLSQGLAFPSPERLREILVLEYGRRLDFIITVNGDRLAIEDIPGEPFSESTKIDGVGLVRLNLTVSDSRKPLKHSGIVIRVGGKIVGRPTYFGLDENEEIPRKLLKKIYGEVEADGLASDVTADWGAIVENSTAFVAIRDWVQKQLEHKVRKVFARDVGLARARRQKLINDRLAGMPEHRRRLAEAALNRVLIKFYGESEDRIDTVLAVMLDAFERDEYWIVVQAIEEARHKGVAQLAEALADFGLVDMTLVAQQARHRLDVLKRLDELMTRPETLEKEMHVVFERNLWLLEGDFKLLSSDRTLATTLQQWAGTEFTGQRARKRPDLFLCSTIDRRYVLIEFKEPGHTIDRSDESQALGYRDDLRKSFEPIDVFVIGGRRASGLDPNRSYPGLHVKTYAEVVSTARSRLEWLINRS